MIYFERIWCLFQLDYDLNIYHWITDLNTILHLSSQLIARQCPKAYFSQQLYNNFVFLMFKTIQLWPMNKTSLARLHVIALQIVVIRLLSNNETILEVHSAEKHQLVWNSTNCLPHYPSFWAGRYIIIDFIILLHYRHINIILHPWYTVENINFFEALVYDPILN